MPWQDQVPGTFGSVDLVFGGHPLDRERARQLLIDASASNVSLPELLDAAETFLRSRGTPPSHIDVQLDRMKKIQYWLS